MSEDTDERILLARKRTILANERNRLANERTFLAWIRTGLVSVGGGVAVMRLLSFQNPSYQILSEAMGSILIFLGIAIFFLSFVDFKRSAEKLKLENGANVSTRLMSCISFTLIFVSFVLLLILFNLSGQATIPFF